MKTRTLGKNFEVSAIGLGCMGFTHAYGAAIDDAEGIKAIQAAVDMGYTLFDTAERYTGFYSDGRKAWNRNNIRLFPNIHAKEICAGVTCFSSASCRTARRKGSFF